MKYSIGYNYDVQFLKLLKPLSKYIESVYFPTPQAISGSGRAIKESKNYPKEIIKDWNHDMNAFIGFEKVIRPRNEIIGDLISRLWDHGQTSACSDHS